MTGVPIPTDDNHAKVQITPAVPAVAVTYDATISASTEITLNAATTMIEVSAIDKTVFMRWGTSDASSTAFDEVISLNTTRSFYVPVDSTTGKLYTAVNFIEETSTAKLAVVEK